MSKNHRHLEKLSFANRCDRLSTKNFSKTNSLILVFLRFCTFAICRQDFLIRSIDFTSHFPLSFICKIKICSSIFLRRMFDIRFFDNGQNCCWTLVIHISLVTSCQWILAKVSKSVHVSRLTKTKMKSN